MDNCDSKSRGIYNDVYGFKVIFKAHDLCSFFLMNDHNRKIVYKP